MAKIKNINGTSNNSCKCGSWLNHYVKFAGRNPTFCSETNCLNKDLVGAHVQKVDPSNNNWYIVPLCSEHNKSKGELDIGSTSLVSANVAVTCGK